MLRPNRTILDLVGVPCNLSGSTGCYPCFATQMFMLFVKYRVCRGWDVGGGLGWII